MTYMTYTVPDVPDSLIGIALGIVTVTIIYLIARLRSPKVLPPRGPSGPRPKYISSVVECPECKTRIAVGLVEERK